MATLDRDELGQLAGGEMPPLRDGQRLDQPTFHQLYLRMPEDFRAELIGGVVRVMASPVRLRHGLSDVDFAWFLKSYSIKTPGTFVASNATTKLNLRNEYQPDIALLIETSLGGQIVEDEKGYLVGCPELVVEIASSTLATDLKDKKQIYEAAGAREYVVVDVEHRALHWFHRRNGQFLYLEVGPDAVFRSGTFPGLWLDARAFFRGDSRTVDAVLQQGLATPEHAAFVAAIARRRANRP